MKVWIINELCKLLQKRQIRRQQLRKNINDYYTKVNKQQMQFEDEEQQIFELFSTFVFIEGQVSKM